MTKDQLLAALEAKPFCRAITTSPSVVETKPDGSVWYQVAILEVSGDAAIYRNIHFYVRNEGTENEDAYWKDREPEATANEQSDNSTAYKMITFRTLLAETPLAPAIISKIKAAAAADTTGVMEEYVSMLSTYTLDGGIDINSAAVQGMISAMAGTVLTPEEVAAVLSLADQT